MHRTVRPHSRPQIDVLENRTLPTTLIALIDTGVNSDSINSAYLDMADAYNAVDGSNNVTDTAGHGTEVSDFIANEIQSSSSLMGVSPSVKILPIKDWDPTLPGGGGVSSDAIIAGIQYAISKGASVINLSVESTVREQNTDQNSPYYEEDIATAIQNAQASNSVVVIAAGNDNEDIDQNPVFPAALADYIPNTNALAVTSASSSGSLNAGVNWGQEDVELAAPLPIPSPFADQSTATSEAAGYVSGVTGVLSALNPGASYATIRNLVTQNVEHESGLSGSPSPGA